MSTPSSPALAARGRALFLLSCAHCHGADAAGDEGPDLHNIEASDRYISNMIARGIKGEMPSFRKELGGTGFSGSRPTFARWSESVSDRRSRAVFRCARLNSAIP